MAVKKEVKIAYFPSETTKIKVLNTNGKSLDHYCIKAETEEDLSTGNYLLDATFLATETKDILHEEAILKVRMDYGEEVFRISKVTKGTRYIDVVARQITIADSLTLFIQDARPTNLKGQAALTWILDKADGVKEIELSSNINTSSTSYYLDKNLYEALHTADNSFIVRWGGEIQRRTYMLKINEKIGVDRGFSIREGKNLTGFEGSSNIDSLVTRAKGKGFNGVEGNFIDSSLINHYSRTYTSVIEYSDVKVKDDYSEEGFDTEDEAKAELDNRIRNEFENNHIDQIKASYSINFVQLEKTEEYAHYQVAEQVFLGDAVRVYIPKHDIDVKVRVRRKKYDILAQRTKEITLSHFVVTSPPTIKDVYESLESIKNENASNLQQAKEYASELIKSGLKNSYVIVRENEIVIGDTKDINTMVNVWRFNKNGLGFSSTGYYGEFGLAITMDGKIVADFITTGVLNADLIKAGSLSADRISGGVLMSKNNNLQFDLNNGRMHLYDNNKLMSTIFNMRNNRINANGMGLLTNSNSFIALGIDDNDDNALYSPHIVLTGKDWSNIYKQGVNFLTRVNFDNNSVLNPQMLFNGFKRNSGDYATLYSANSDSNYSKLILELGDDYKSMFEICHKFYNKDGADMVASFRAAGGSESNVSNVTGIKFFQNLGMQGKNIWGIGTAQADLIETQTASVKEIAVQQLSLTKIARFNIDADVKYRIPASLLESIEHFGHAELSDNYCRVDLPIGFNHQGYIVTISPLSSGDYEIIKRDEYFEIKGDIESFDYVVKGFI